MVQSIVFCYWVITTSYPDKRKNRRNVEMFLKCCWLPVSYYDCFVNRESWPSLDLSNKHHISCRVGDRLTQNKTFSLIIIGARFDGYFLGKQKPWVSCSFVILVHFSPTHNFELQSFSELSCLMMQRSSFPSHH